MFDGAEELEAPFATAAALSSGELEQMQVREMTLSEPRLERRIKSRFDLKSRFAKSHG